ncbi:MAG: hypothetical protein V7711_06325 [Pseudomonadales bacterium]
MSVTKPDGRLQRSERSRQQIVDAMIKLMHRGVYIPTAQQVADQADISIRTVFRHFSEMDQLYLEIDEVLKPLYLQFFEQQSFAGSLEERINKAVDARLKTYIETYHLEKATHALLWRSEKISTRYQQNQLLLRKNLMKMLPELKTAKPETRETVDAVTSFEFFERLQMHQGLSEKTCRQLIYNLVLDLITRK